MNNLRLFSAVWCPHCRNAKGWIAEIKKENPRYKDIAIEEIDVDQDKEKLEGTSFDLIPTFYLGDEKIFEGAPTKDDIQAVLEKAL